MSGLRRRGVRVEEVLDDDQALLLQAQLQAEENEHKTTAKNAVDMIAAFKKAEIQNVTDAKQASTLSKKIEQESVQGLQDLIGLSPFGANILYSLAQMGVKNYIKNQEITDNLVENIKRQLTAAGISLSAEFEKFPLETFLDCSTVESYKVAKYINTNNVENLNLGANNLDLIGDDESIKSRKIFFRKAKEEILKYQEDFRQNGGEIKVNNTLDITLETISFIFVGIAWAAAAKLSYNAYNELIKMLWNFRIEKLQDFAKLGKNDISKLSAMERDKLDMSVTGSMKTPYTLDELREKAKELDLPESIVKIINIPGKYFGSSEEIIIDESEKKELNLFGNVATTITKNSQKFVSDFVSTFLPNLDKLDFITLVGKAGGLLAPINMWTIVKSVIVNFDIITLRNLTIIFSGVMYWMPLIQKIMWFSIRNGMIFSNPMALKRFFYVLMTKLYTENMWYRYDVMLIRHLQIQFNIDSQSLKKFQFSSKKSKNKKSKKRSAKKIKKSLKRSSNKSVKKMKKMKKSIKRSDKKKSLRRK